MSADRAAALVVRPPGEVVLEERDFPVPGPGEVLIRPGHGRAVRHGPGSRGGPGRSRLHALPAGARARMVRDRGRPVAGKRRRAGRSRRWAPGWSARGSCRAGTARAAGPARRTCALPTTNLASPATARPLGIRGGGTAGASIGPAVSAEDAALVEPASVVYRALAAARWRPGCRALVVGDGTVALLAVRLVGLWSPARSSCSAAARARRAGRHRGRGQVRDLA